MFTNWKKKTKNTPIFWNQDYNFNAQRHQSVKLKKTSVTYYHCVIETKLGLFTSVMVFYTLVRLNIKTPANLQGTHKMKRKINVLIRQICSQETQKSTN